MPPVTKPGNSDDDERPTGAEDELAKDETAEEPATEPAADEPEAEKADDPEPLMTELEKAPPAPEDEPVMPTAAEAARRRSDQPTPRVLKIAFYLAVGSAVIGIAAAIQLFTLKQTITQDLLTNNRDIKPADAERAVGAAVWLYLIVTVVFGAFIALFAYKAQEGVRRSRMLLLIVTVILLCFYLLSPVLTYLSLFSGLLAAVMIVLPYLPSTREYFGPRQTVK